MKIIEEGVVPKYTLKCKHCQTKFEYERHELHYSLYGKFIQIDCPLCKVQLSWLRGENPTEI
jgi:hypothetical protein